MFSSQDALSLMGKSLEKKDLFSVKKRFQRQRSKIATYIPTVFTHILQGGHKENTLHNIYQKSRGHHQGLGILRWEVSSSGKMVRNKNEIIKVNYLEILNSCIVFAFIFIFLLFYCFVLTSIYRHDNYIHCGKSSYKQRYFFLKNEYLLSI